MRKLLELNKQENGYSLAGVLIIFIVATVLGMSIVALSVNSMNISNKEHDDQSAFYIAESGTTYRVAQVETLVKDATTETEDFITDVIEDPNPPNFDIYGAMSEDEINEIIQKKFYELFDEKLNPDETIKTVNYNKFEPIKGDQPEAEITVELDPSSVDPTENPKIYNVISTGTIGDESRLVHLPIEINWHSKPEYALLTEMGITAGYGGASNNFVIEGDIGVINDDPNSIDFENGATDGLSGSIFVPDGNINIVNPEPVPNRPIEPLDDSTTLPTLPPFPDIPIGLHEPGDVSEGSHKVIDNGNLYATGSQGDNFMFNLSEDMVLKDFIINENNYITINVGNSDKTLVVNNMYLTGNINVVGTGKLTLFVKGEFKLVSGTIAYTEEITGSDGIDEIHEKKLKGVKHIDFYYAGSQPITMFAGEHAFASIYVKDAIIRFENGRFYGNILSGSEEEVYFSGGLEANSQLILAPKAHINHQNGVIKGVIVSKEYEINTGNLIYEDLDYGSGPLSLDGVMNHPDNADNTFMQRPDPGFYKQSLREK